MKKSILALLVLLFLLILTCVYQKTDVLYAKYNDTPPNTLATITPTPLSRIAKETTMVKSEEKKIEKEIIITKTEAEVLPKPIVKQKILPVPVSTKQKILPIPVSTKQNDIEEIDSLMQALKEREDAFKNRDEFELHLRQLIKQALENRSAAIAHMNKEELHLIELQKELIKARDRVYDKIGQTNIPTSGE